MCVCTVYCVAVNFANYYSSVICDLVMDGRASPLDMYTVYKMHRQSICTPMCVCGCVSNRIFMNEFHECT